ncbi:ANTAR domain-containing protein [Amycolatopsis sp. NPDC089917]|uniref:ANTAR domain-containing protein n=1 Tax=Amycolatopsis sp. NPDC089917 TaxID=3155187 RepID=UPI003440344E
MVDHLRRALETQPVIDQAKGMLMLLWSQSSEDAFSQLRYISQRANVKLCEVAAIVVASGSGQTLPVEDTTAAKVLTELRCVPRRNGL